MDFKAKKFDELTAGELYEILKSRAEIFIVEQKITYQDLDDIDYRSMHFFITDGGRAVAYLRAFLIDGSTVKLGRVLTLHHGNGIGRELMEKTIDKIKSCADISKIYISAQKHAVGFYEKFGFRVTSDEFLEEGIVHVSMELDIAE